MSDGVNTIFSDVVVEPSFDQRDASFEGCYNYIVNWVFNFYECLLEASDRLPIRLTLMLGIVEQLVHHIGFCPIVPEPLDAFKSNIGPKSNRLMRQLTKLHRGFTL